MGNYLLDIYCNNSSPLGDNDKYKYNKNRGIKMKEINFKIEIPKYKNTTEVGIVGDIHRGNKYHDERLWNKYHIGSPAHKGFVDDNNMYIICIGDLMETALKDSLGVQDQSEWIEDQYLWILEQLEPIRDEGRLIGVIEGNHEKRASRNWLRTTRLLAKQLKVPYSDGYLVVNIKLKKGDKEREYKLATHHGYGYARTEGGKMHAVMRMADIVSDADAYVMGHLHDKFAKIKPIYRDGVVVDRLFGMTGAYLKYGGYVEERLYGPPARGSLKLKLHFDIDRITGR